MIKKALTTLVSLSPLIFAAPAVADWPVAIADKFVVHQSHPTTQLDLLKNDIGKNLKLSDFNEWSENGARIRVSNLGPSSRQNGYIYGDVSYQPKDGFVGQDGFWYVIEDDQGRKNSIRVVVNVKAETSPLPAPQEDTVLVPKNTPVRINALSNDLFSDKRVSAGVFTFRGVIVDYNFRSAKGGKVEKVEVYPDDRLRFGSGRQGFQYTENTFKYQFKYTPPAGFVGTDTFTYAVRDSLDTRGDEINSTIKWTKVTLKVGATDKGPWPSASPDKVSLTFTPFTPVNDIDVLRNDRGKNLLIKLNSAYSQKGGRLLVVPNHMDHPVISYSPPFDEGQDRIWYIIEDEYGRRNYSYVDVTVNFTR